MEAINFAVHPCNPRLDSRYTNSLELPFGVESLHYHPQKRMNEPGTHEGSSPYQALQVTK